MRRHLSLAAILMAVWLLFSGHFDPFFITLGVISVLLAVGIGSLQTLLDRAGEILLEGRRARGGDPLRERQRRCDSLPPLPGSPSHPANS